MENEKVIFIIIYFQFLIITNLFKLSPIWLNARMLHSQRSRSGYEWFHKLQRCV